MKVSPALRALVVEDSPVIRADLVSQLKKLGLDCTEAENGHIGWVMLQNVKNDIQRRPDVIFSDVNMPEMDGLQLLEKIRSDKTYGKIPVLILTTNKDELLKMTALCLDVNAFFIKPAEPTRLVSQLQKLFPDRKWT